MIKDKSNRMAWPVRCYRRLREHLARSSPAQVTVEYMLVIVILIVPMAMALDVLFEALQVLFNKLGYIMGRPYP